MSKNFKKISKLLVALLISSAAYSQQTLELPMDPNQVIGNTPQTNGGLGPVTSFIVADKINLKLDAANNNTFTNPIASQVTNVSLSFANQQYTTFSYTGNNVTAGLLFGATATTAYDPNFAQENNGGGGVQRPQEVTPFNLFNEIGAYSSPGAGLGGGPLNSHFTSYPSVGTGNGVTAVFDPPLTPGNSGNGAFSVFTVAQVQFDGGVTGVNNPSPYAANIRYNYGELVITFNRFVTNPVVHIAGLGGAYRYFTGGATNVPANWRSTYFSTELELVSPGSLTSLSGNSNFAVTPNDIKNSAVLPSGGSSVDGPSLGYPFEDFDNGLVSGVKKGAATGSVQVSGVHRVIRFRVWLRGAPSVAGGTPGSADFPWSAPRTASNQYNREPVTGDLWWVSVSTEPASLIPLAATGVNLTAALNGNDVQLKWKTETEANTSYFEIERSIDGRNFSSIGNKNAAGYSTTTVNYDMVDANMNVSAYYYRLKLVDIDGRFTYSNIATVRKSNVKSVKLFPNPASSQVNLEFSNTKGNYVVGVYNQAGQEVFTQKATITYGVQYITINRNTLASGSYIVRVRNTENSEVVFAEKIILQ